MVAQNKLKDQDLFTCNEHLTSLKDILSESNILRLLIKYNLYNSSKKQRLHHTIVFLVLALIQVMCTGSYVSLRDWYDVYTFLCCEKGYRSAAFRSFERYLNKICKDNSELSEIPSKSASKSYGSVFLSKGRACHALDEMSASPLLSLITELIEQVNTQSNMPLGYGDKLLKAINGEDFITNIIIVDGSNLRMPDAAANIDGQTKTCKGLTGTLARKIHLGLNAVTLTVDSLYIGSGVSNERIPNIFTSDNKQTLFIADAGYISFDLFKNINNDGNYYLIKARQNTNPHIISCKIYESKNMLNDDNEEIACNQVNLICELSEEECKAMAKDNEHCTYADLQRHLQDLIQENHMTDDTYCLDMQIEQDGLTCRLLRIYNPAIASSRSDCSFCFLYTNLPQDKMPIIQAWLTYKIRWQIENYFKGLKSSTGLSHWNPKNKVLTDIFAYTEILVHLIKMRLGQIAQNVTNKTYSHLKLARIDLFKILNIINAPSPSKNAFIKRTSSKRIRSKREREHQEKINGKYGGAYKFLILMSSFVCSNISRSNKIKLKSYKEVIRVITSLPI